MNKILIKYSIVVVASLAVLYPLWIRLQSLYWSWNLSNIVLNVFPLFGLLAFTLLWLHAMSGVLEPWLRKYINFDQFVHSTATIILFSIILHPLLLLINLRFNISNLFLYYGFTSIWLGIISWLLLITYDIGKSLQKYPFFVKNWQNILTISTIGFILIFFHSLALGSDLQSGPLRIIWIFYGCTAILATIYTYGIKRFLK